MPFEVTICDLKSSVALAERAEQQSVALEFIKPGKPMQNGFVERFNRSYREAVLYVRVSKLG